MENKRGQWGSNFGFLMAAVGSAVGLGNIWGFPYKMGKGGGFTFLLIYLILVVLVGFAVMLGELALGRKTGRGAVGTYVALSKKYTWIGYMGVASGFLILSFYSVLGGIVLKYMISFLVELFAPGQGFMGLDSGAFFGSFLVNGGEMVLFYAIFMAITMVIVMGGISGGIEKFSKVAMPALAVMLIITIIRSVTLPGASAGLEFMFKPDFSVLAGGGFLKVLSSAAGQMFFSLSLGMGCMITYGSYLSKKDNLENNAIIIPIADTLMALMAGMAVMPAVAAFGHDFGAGPGLLFVTLQDVFLNGMGGAIGAIFGFLFYFLVLIAAVTSSISLLEVCTAYSIDKKIEQGKEPNRKKITAILAGIIFIVGLPVAFDGLGSNIAGGAIMNSPGAMLGMATPPPAFADWLDLYDLLAEGIMMPLGAMLMSIIIGWAIGAKAIKDEVELSPSVKLKAYKFWAFCFKFAVPVIMVFVLLGQLDTFFGLGIF